MAKAPASAPKPSHYKITVGRSVEVAKISMRPGGTYTIKAKVYDLLKEMVPSPITSEQPFSAE